MDKKPLPFVVAWKAVGKERLSLIVWKFTINQTIKNTLKGLIRLWKTREISQNPWYSILVKRKHAKLVNWHMSAFYHLPTGKNYTRLDFPAVLWARVPRPRGCKRLEIEPTFTHAYDYASRLHGGDGNRIVLKTLSKVERIRLRVPCKWGNRTRVVFKTTGFWHEKCHPGEISTAQNGEHAETCRACFCYNYFICGVASLARFALLNTNDGAARYYRVRIPPNKICHGHDAKAPKIRVNALKPCTFEMVLKSCNRVDLKPRSCKRSLRDKKQHLNKERNAHAYLIIKFSSSNSWSSCMLDAPEKSQPKRFCPETK